MSNYFYLFRPKYPCQNSQVLLLSLRQVFIQCIRWPGRDINNKNTLQTLFCRQLSFKYCAKHFFKLKYCILSKMNTHYFTKIVQHVFTKTSKTLRGHVDARDVKCYYSFQLHFCYFNKSNIVM